MRNHIALNPIALLQMLRHLPIATLVDLMQEPVPDERPQLRKERELMEDYTALYGMKTGTGTRIFTHDAIVMLLAKQYFYKMSTVDAIIRGAYDRRR